MTIDIIVILSGLMASLILYRRFSYLPKNGTEKIGLSISVIIPARNEEKNLPHLLSDLKMQTQRPFEIICVDDMSEDETATIAASFDVKLISIEKKPDGWMGKTWACQKGAEAAKGDVVLFLDADVRLAPDGLLRLASAYATHHRTFSVQPFHVTPTWPEQMSLFFNIIQVGANALGMPRRQPVGMSGPVILFLRSDYEAIGGHAAVKKSVIEDVALGKTLHKKGISYDLYLGDRDFSFRMYGDGIKALVFGWTKNIANGAAKTPWLRFLMIFLWITSCTSVSIQFFLHIIRGDTIGIVIFSFLYVLWVIELLRIARVVGSFHMLTIIFFPVPLLIFILIFIGAAFRRLFRIRSTWKGRKV